MRADSLLPGFLHSFLPPTIQLTLVPASELSNVLATSTELRTYTSYIFSFVCKH